MCTARVNVLMVLSVYVLTTGCVCVFLCVCQQAGIKNCTFCHNFFSCAFTLPNSQQEERGRGNKCRVGLFLLYTAYIPLLRCNHSALYICYQMCHLQPSLTLCVCVCVCVNHDCPECFAFMLCSIL